jgi:hypothetical protein
MAFDASASAVGPSYRGFTVQGTPTPPPKTHRLVLVGLLGSIKFACERCFCDVEGAVFVYS